MRDLTSSHTAMIAACQEDLKLKACMQLGRSLFKFRKFFVRLQVE